MNAPTTITIRRRWDGGDNDNGGTTTSVTDDPLNTKIESLSITLKKRSADNRTVVQALAHAAEVRASAPVTVLDLARLPNDERCSVLATVLVATRRHHHQQRTLSSSSSLSSSDCPRFDHRRRRPPPSHHHSRHHHRRHHHHRIRLAAAAVNIPIAVIAESAFVVAFVV